MFRRKREEAKPHSHVVPREEDYQQALTYLWHRIDQTDAVVRDQAELIRLFEQIESAHPLAVAIAQRRQEMIDNGELDFLALEEAARRVESEENQQLISSLAALAIRERAAEVRRLITPADVDRIRAHLHETYLHNGTYAEIDDGVFHERDEHIREELLVERREQTGRELNTPEAQAKRTHEIVSSPEFQADLKAAKAEVKREHDAGLWLDAKELAIEAYRRKLEEKGKDKAAKIARKIEKEGYVTEGIRLDIEAYSRELVELLQSTGTPMPDELVRELLQEPFETTGTDTELFCKGQIITLDLEQQGEGRVIAERSLTLLALGGGRFIVEKYTGHNSSDIKKSKLFKNGTIIRIGTAAASKHTRAIDETIRRGMPFGIYHNDSGFTPITTQYTMAGLQVDVPVGEENHDEVEGQTRKGKWDWIAESIEGAQRNLEIEFAEERKRRSRLFTHQELMHLSTGELDIDALSD